MYLTLEKKMTILAVVTARKGSKRLPGKNMKSFHGIPLVEHSFNAAKNSKYVDRVVVTTDDDLIIELASKSWVDAIKRPDNLACDTSSSVSVVSHLLEMPDYGIYDLLVLLQPTSPLRVSSHIDEAIELYFKTKCNSVISITEESHSPYKSFVMDKNYEWLKPLYDYEILESGGAGEQKVLRQNGAMYITGVATFLENRSFFTPPISGYTMSEFESVDIDTIVDFKFAEFVFDMIDE